MSSAVLPCVVRRLGLVPYADTLQAMQDFTATRTADTQDELWLLQHPPVFTQGLAGKPEHVLHDLGIPVVNIDRGGQVTYHGPGQVVVYLLLDLNRRSYKVRELVWRMEQALIEVLGEAGVPAQRKAGAPGVYVANPHAHGDTAGEVELAKIAALGLRVRHGCTYHGLSLNVDMDLSPFAAINPCGYAGLAVTQCRDVGWAVSPELAGEAIVSALQRTLA